MVQKFTQFKVEWKSNPLWKVFHFFVLRCLYYPGNLGTLVPLNGKVYLEGTSENSRYESLTPHRKDCYAQFLLEWSRIRKGTRFFTIKWFFHPTFRRKVERACVFRILCAHFLRYHRVPQTEQIELAKFLANGRHYKLHLLWISGQPYRIKKVLAEHGEECVKTLTYPPCHLSQTPL